MQTEERVNMIYGNTEGIRKSILSQLELLYGIQTDPEEYVSLELINALARLTETIRREISIYLLRDGTVADVSVGDRKTVGLRYLERKRRSGKLSGIRCIHTHPNGNCLLSDADLSCLDSMRLDSIAAVGVAEGKCTGVQAAFLEAEDGRIAVHTTAAFPVHRIPQHDWIYQIERSDQMIRRLPQDLSTQGESENVYLVSIQDPYSMKELRGLADTAGGIVVGSMIQKREKGDRATYIGPGKLQELALECQIKEADTVIFDCELTGAQVRNIEAALNGVKIIDRTTLILDIFAQRAKSKEGRLQVELAQLNYQLPRLTGYGMVMSRLGGGIGTRGPGETQLELDRRKIRKRIEDLKAQITALSNQRELRRGKRKKSEIPVVALVGYTNAGKTTLLNALSGANGEAEDKLFATLDPLSRVVKLPNGGSFLLVDTVGFVSNLPHSLIDAFRSTLEETIQADLLLIVSDVSAENSVLQHEVVMSVLEELGAADKPRIEVLNKSDLLASFPQTEHSAAISAISGQGIEDLLKKIEEALQAERRILEVLVPFQSGFVLSEIYDEAKVLKSDYEELETKLEILASGAFANRLQRMAKNGVIEIRKVLERA